MKTLTGTITGAKMTNTVTVTVHRSIVHPLYKKRFRVSKKFLADTNGQTVGMGDEVVITECRPLSKRKHFKVTEITKKAPAVSEIKMEAAVEKLITKPEKKDEDTSTPAA